MPEIFDAAFESLGRRREDMYDLHLAAPAYKIHYHDGRSLHLSSDLVAMGKMLEEFERPAGSKDPLGSFMSFIKEAGEHYEESIKHVLTLDWTHLLGALTRWELYPMLLRTKVLHIYTTLYARARCVALRPTAM
jgi:phytoene desaturase (3,4-didehydrolycopene-forming)